MTHTQPGKNLFLFRQSSIIFYGFILIFFSCANKVAPTGGNKDVTPPKLVSSSPENFSTAYTGKEIKAEFDEYIQLVDLSKQLIISPIISPAPEIEAVKKTLSIKFENTLEENKTYTLNFGNAIADIHEKNSYENFQFVFSTGIYLDSLSVEGRVSFAENGKSEKGILVMLYKNDNDSVPLKGLPDYFARTSDDGQFKISNISAGSFKIFALKDRNSNYLFDQPDEEIAFLNDPIHSEDSSRTDLKLFKNEVEKLRLKSSVAETRNKIKIAFNTRAENITMKAEGSNAAPWAVEEYSTNRDTIVLWNTDTTKDSLKVIFYQAGLAFDTASFYMKKSASGKGSAIPKSTGVENNIINNFLESGKDFSLRFTSPIASVHREKISFTKDSIAFSDIKYNFIDSIKRNLTFNYPWKENEQYEIIFYPGAFNDIFNLTNDTVKIHFQLKPLSETGNVVLNLKTSRDGNYIVQLVNEKDEIIRVAAATSSGDLTFNSLNPVSSRFRIIVDENKNMRWDTGNYLKKKQPEKIIYFKEPVNVRANWDLEVEWILE